MNKEFEEILNKVSVLYRKYGIRSITMDDLAHELGISKKTLYLYVRDKSELVGKVVEYSGLFGPAGIKELLETRGNAIEQLIGVSQKFHALLRENSPAYEYDLKKYYPGHYRKLMSARRKMMYEIVVANIRQGKKEDIYREELDEEIIAKLHMMRIENLRSNELFKENVVQSSKFFREIFIYHIHGLATSYGLEVLERNMERLEQAEARK